MKNQKRRKAWLIIFATCLAICLAMLSYNWIQNQRINTQVEAIRNTPQSDNLQAQQESQIQQLTLQVENMKYKRNRYIWGFFSVVLGLVTSLVFIFWIRQQKASDPTELIDQIGNSP